VRPLPAQRRFDTPFERGYIPVARFSELDDDAQRSGRAFRIPLESSPASKGRPPVSMSIAMSNKAFFGPGSGELDRDPIT